MRKIEIACCNLESVINANLAGASRVELFENMIEGGCTPSYGLIKKAKEISKIPIYVMIRPRAGDFCYNIDELGIMKSDIEICKALDVDGIVFGVLNDKKEVDTFACKDLLESWGHASATFHRAFDMIGNQRKACEELINLGFERILTSGGQDTASEGLETIRMLHDTYGNQISIMAGCGITSENARLFNFLPEIHATCKEKVMSKDMFGTYIISRLDSIKEMVEKRKQTFI